MEAKESKIKIVKDKYLKILHDYLENENFYDIVKYSQGHDGRGLSNIAKWVTFAKENLSKEEYEMFLEKALPLEPKADGSDKEEKEALKQKVIELSKKIFQQKAGLIDIYDELTPHVAKYMYMVKQLRFNYKEIPAHVFNKNLEYCDMVDRYNSPKILYGARVMSISDQENEMVEKIVTDRGMALNDITYMEAYKYAIRQEIIKINKPKSR